ncbi:DoxX family membrane protein [Streptomyces sp. GXMU-J15]|uniref:DoxX family membrane protein n=1 Tax=Streptomyces fuscus TaxID=3048495 RepID=A0ABT7IUV8_9ACTN|nr:MULTISPECIES: DoxX family membrane protein [Streptomyces]MDL2076368.1 DoxX family membrane protein [Streptomyces fuscus]SBT89052.1 DoxX protein [Streptomyces sp. DI166]
MAPLVILVAVTLALLTAGALGVQRLRPWPVAVRGGLAAMFTATGISHFVGMRDVLISMVPPEVPAPGFWVTATGVLELAGAAGLLWNRTAVWAAGCLSALLVALFPANVYAARNHVLTAWDDQLWPRTVMQILFLAATLGVVVHHLKHRARV